MTELTIEEIEKLLEELDELRSLYLTLRDERDSLLRDWDAAQRETIKWQDEAKRLLRVTQRQAKDIAHLQNANDALRAQLRRRPDDWVLPPSNESIV